MGELNRHLSIRRTYVLACATTLLLTVAARGRAAAANPPTATEVMQSTQLKTSGVCPTGYRALVFQNNCSFAVYLGENLSQPQVDGTPTCTKDSDCTNGTVNANLRCVAGSTKSPTGLCTLTCSSDVDCGPNQTCFMGNVSSGVNAWYEVNSTQAVGECWFSNLEPRALSSPTPSSNWKLPKSGGKAVVCVPEAQENPAKAKLGASCTQNSDCASDNCYDRNAPAHQCTPGDLNCECGALFSWSGNFWGRTDCTVNSAGDLSCETGNCGAANGQPARLDCSGNASSTPMGGQNPENLSEFTLLNPQDGTDTYDTSMVNGFNVGFSVAPVAGTYSPNLGTCKSPGAGCSFNLLSTCPAQLQYKDSASSVVGCWAPAQACQMGTAAQQAALGCTNNVPFLCRTASDCPYGQQSTPAQTMTCNIQSGQAFGQCECTQDSDCPCGYVCGGGGTCILGSGSLGPGTSATWADLYGCANYFGQLTPYGAPGARGTCPALGSTSLETGIVCGCPSWSTAGECKADNINWESVPVGSTGPIASPSSSPTPSVGEMYLNFHNACATSYAYPYDDNAGTISCGAASSALVGPSYDITFCPTPVAPTPTTTATATGTPSATATPTTTPTGTASLTATPTATPTPAVKCSPSFAYLYPNPAGTLSFSALSPGQRSAQTVTVTNYSGATLRLSARVRGGDADDFKVTGGSCRANRRLPANATCGYIVTFKARRNDAGGAVQAFLRIKGRYRPRKVCPAGSYQIVILTLAGYVNPK